MSAAEKALDFARTARERFQNCSKEEKRELVTSFGLNPILENRKLRLDYVKPFELIHEASKRLQDPANKIEPVEKIVTKGQTFHFDPENPIWGDRRGSNPRQPVPQTGALPAELRPPRIHLRYYTKFMY